MRMVSSIALSDGEARLRERARYGGLLPAAPIPASATVGAVPPKISVKCNGSYLEGCHCVLGQVSRSLPLFNDTQPEEFGGRGEGRGERERGREKREPSVGGEAIRFSGWCEIGDAGDLDEQLRGSG